MPASRHDTMDGDTLLRRAVYHGGGWTIGLAVVAVAGIAAELALPAILGRALDAVLARTSAGWWLAGAAGLVLLAAAAETVSDLASGRTAARATARLRHALMGHLLALHPAARRRFPNGDLVSRLVAQVPQAGQAGAIVVRLATTALPPLGSLVALVVIDRWLGVTFVTALLVLAVLLRRFVADASDAATGYQRGQSRVASRLSEALAGARTIAAAATADREIDRVLVPLPALRRHGLRTWTTLARAAGRGAAVAPLLQLSVVAVGGLALAGGRLTPGELLAAIQYAALGAGVGGVVEVLHGLANTRAGSRRTAEVLAAPVRHYGTVRSAEGPGTLELRAVTVHPDPDRYGDRTTPLLDRVDLVIPGGTAMAVVGRSGSGKSVLAEVAGRLRDPDEGVVSLDRVPLAELSHAALRAAVGYAFERPVLVGATLTEVITLGRAGEPDAAWARRAAHTARVDTFVERLPSGYRTPLADAPMSGGEAQRLGLARALPAGKLLILDDATSSLDTVTEVEISQALSRAARGRTQLVVAHRVGTAARCDLVAWLEHGRIRAVGRHQELWRDPDYQALFHPERS